MRSIFFYAVNLKFYEFLYNQYCDIKVVVDKFKITALPRLPNDWLSHHSSQKLSAVNSWVHWAIFISQRDNLQNEVDHVQSSLLNNDYRKTNIQCTMKRRRNPSSCRKKFSNKIKYIFMAVSWYKPRYILFLKTRQLFPFHIFGSFPNIFQNLT